MMSMITAVVTMMMFKAVLGYQAGAPASACDSMTPSHDGNLAQSSSFPNTITASASTYRCGETITGKWFCITSLRPTDRLMVVFLL